jgi:hypothetical protein
VATYTLWVSSLHTLEAARAEVGRPIETLPMTKLKPGDEEGVEFLP